MLKNGISDQPSLDQNQLNEMHDAVNLLITGGAIFLLDDDDIAITNLNGVKDMKAAAEAVSAFILRNKQDRLLFIKGLVRILRNKRGV